MTDVFELIYGLDPADPRDGADDPDGDFLTNLEESQAYTNPRQYLTLGLEPPIVADLDNSTGEARISSRNGEALLRLADNDYEIVFQAEKPPGLKRNNGPVKGHEWDDDWDGDGLDTFSELYLTQTDARMPKGSEEESMRMETQDEPQPQQPQPQPLQPQPQPLQPQPLQPQPLQPQPQQPQPQQPQPQQPQPQQPQPQPVPEFSWEVSWGDAGRSTTYGSGGSINHESGTVLDINGIAGYSSPNVPTLAALHSLVQHAPDGNPSDTWIGMYQYVNSVALNSSRYYPLDYQTKNIQTAGFPNGVLHEGITQYKFRLKKLFVSTEDASVTCMVVRRVWNTYPGSAYTDTVIGNQTFTVPAGDTFSAGYISTPPTAPSTGTAVATYLVPINMDIWNGQYTQNALPVKDTDKYTIGAFTVANLNDSNGNTVLDNHPSETTVAGEEDLMKLRIHGYAGLPGKVKVTVKSGSVKFWTDSTKQTEIPLQNGAVLFDIPTTGMPIEKIIWVEATAASTSLQDIEIWEGYQNAQNTLTDGTDMVKATAVWVDKVSTKNANSDTLWADADGADIGNTFTNAMGMFGINFGSATGDFYYSIGYEFIVKPNNIGAQPGVKFDVTRQIENKYFQLVGGIWHQILTPWENFNADDSATDDGYATDEDNDPTNNHIYSLDGPGFINDGYAIELVGKINLKEFVRVSFDGNRPAGENDSGSRCSNKELWHAHYWVEGNGSSYSPKSGKTNSVGTGHINLGSDSAP